MSDNAPSVDGGAPLDLTPRDEVTPLGTVGTDFLMYAVGGGANIESQADYNADPQRPTGALPGLARSNFHNKAMRQGTFVAHSLCLWISQQLQQYIPDDGNDIAWIGEFSSALSAYMLALIPPGPNLGAYLPLAGGTMVGNIQFQSGISTVLANNTWYYARDTGGTARGLIIKSSDNNVYINDGSSPYVVINGSPVVANNVSWSGRDTGGTARPVVGLLSDNSVHVAGGSSGSIYLDTASGGSVWVTGNAGNIVIPNNAFYYGRDPSNNPRGIIGINTVNQLSIGGGHTGTTDIYAGVGQLIYLHNNANALGQLTVNQYTYLNGGGRAYIPGGNDPWQIYADHGFYARTHYIVGGTRDWTEGCGPGGTYLVADETASAVRFEIDLSGHGHFYQSLFVVGQLTTGQGIYVDSATITRGLVVNGGANIYNGLNVQSGNLGVSAYTALYGGCYVANGLNVASGGISVTGATTFNSGGTVYNGLAIASGGLSVAGALNAYSNGYIAGTWQIGGCSPLYDAGSNYLTTAGNFQVYQGTIITWNLNANGNIGCANQISASGPLITASYLSVTSTIYGYSDCIISGRVTGSGSVNTPYYYISNAPFAHMGAQDAFTILTPNGYPCLTLYSTGYNYYSNNFHLFTYLGTTNTFVQFNGGVTYNVEGFWRTFSGAELKRDIEPYERGLDALRRLRPVSFRYRDDAPMGGGPDAAQMRYGLIAQEVEQVVPEMVGQTMVPDRRSGEEHNYATVAPGMLVYLLTNAVKELAERLEALEGRA
jgi:hypothetical protein